MKISFCITCKGRLDHLKATLPKNIKDNLPLSSKDPQVEFVVLDYDCPKDTIGWLLNDPDIKPYLDNGVVKVASLDNNGTKNFHHAHAKNIAHRLATGDVVCNLDADNYTGSRFANYLAEAFEEDSQIIVHPCNSINAKVPKEERGFYGRIAMTMENFISLGGYDEVKYPAGCSWGGEDTHLIRRARIAGLQDSKITDMEYLSVISHDNIDRVKLSVDADNVDAEVSRLDEEYSRKQALEDRLYVIFNHAQSESKGSFGLGKLKVGLNQEPMSLSSIDFLDRSVAHRTITGLSCMFGAYTKQKITRVLEKTGIINIGVPII